MDDKGTKRRVNNKGTDWRRLNDEKEPWREIGFAQRKNRLHRQKLNRDEKKRKKEKVVKGGWWSEKKKNRKN